MEYQRHVHLQRLGEQEAEMQARLDQQRRYAQQREQQNQVDCRSARRAVTRSILFHVRSDVLRPSLLTFGILPRPAADALDAIRLASHIHETYVDLHVK